MWTEEIMLLEKCAEKVPIIAKVVEHPGWAKLWDHTLDLGEGYFRPADD